MWIPLDYYHYRPTTRSPTGAHTITDAIHSDERRTLTKGAFCALTHIAVAVLPPHRRQFPTRSIETEPSLPECDVWAEVVQTARDLGQICTDVFYSGSCPVESLTSTTISALIRTFG